MLRAPLAFLGRQQALGVRLPLELAEERCSGLRGRFRRVTTCVHRVRRYPGA
jgi:hypothetical protein